MNRIMITVLAAALAAALWAAQGVPAEAQLQAAITKETVDGDLEQAISLYKKIVAAHVGNRAVTAQALLRMGQCYEKLGMAESRKAYERVVKEFSDQNAQAVMARERLAKLGHSTASAGVTVRQVWTRPGLSLDDSRIFPDGRRLAFVDWSDHHDNLVVVDMVTGETRKLTSSGENDGAVYHAVSPDSKLIAYYWYLKGGSELRVVGTDGSAPRTVYSSPQVDVEPAAWLPDGKSLVARLFRGDQTAQLAVISMTGGQIRVLKSAPWTQLDGTINVSPDGRHILCDFPSSASAAERDIFLMAADGSSETALVRHPSDDTLLGWTPDGKSILFRSNRSGSTSIWLLPMSGNKPGGEPRQLKSNVGNIQPLGFDRNGSFYYSESIGAGREVYVAELNSETGKIVGTAKVASVRHIGEKGVASFSPDGKALVYQTGPTRDGHGPRTAKGITVRSLDSGEERDLAAPMSYINALFHTGEEIRIVGRDEKGRMGLFALEPRSSALKLIGQPGESAKYGKVRMIQRQLEGFRTVERDPKTGQETVLVPEKSGTFRNQGARSSPDWKWLVWRSIDRVAGEVRLMSVRETGGKPITLAVAKRPVEITTHFLMSDSKYVLFSMGENANDEIWRVPIAGGEPVATGLKAKRIQSISVHPDGRQVAIGSFGDTQDSVWVMENYLPR